MALSAGLDHEASDFELAAAARHLHTCPACRLFSEQVGATTADLRSRPALMPSRSLTPAFDRRVRRRWPRVVIPAAAAVAASALLGAGLADRLHTAPHPASQATLRLASRDVNQVQAAIRSQRLAQLLGRDRPDPVIDRSLRRQLLG